MKVLVKVNGSQAVIESSSTWQAILDYAEQLGIEMIHSAFAKKVG